MAKADTRVRNDIPIKDRLAITLRLLATGYLLSSLKYFFKIHNKEAEL